MTTIGDGRPRVRASAGRFFAEPLRDYVHAGLGRSVSVLQAGCLAPLRELGIGELEEQGFEVSVSVVDTGDPFARQVLAQTGGAYDDVIVGDLRTVPLPRRAFDVVYCAGLLERVPHVSLVLDRLTSALRPGGLLLLRFTDRDSAAGALDRWLPSPARHAIWRRTRPGVPGPFPAVYEQTATEQGITSFALRRGLVIAQRSAERAIPGAPGTAGPGRLTSSVHMACGAIRRLSGGRYDDLHDELLYVIRKPQDAFARVV